VWRGVVTSKLAGFLYLNASPVDSCDTIPFSKAVRTSHILTEPPWQSLKPILLLYLLCVASTTMAHLINSLSCSLV
jgi:hypothetical protein